jgi:hypothetical protein
MFISIAVRFNNTAGLIGTQRAGSLLYGYLHSGEPCRFDTVEIYLPLRVCSRGSQTVVESLLVILEFCKFKGSCLVLFNDALSTGYYNSNK